MSLIGIVANKKDIQAIKKKISVYNCDIIEINKQSINNLKNIQFDEIIFLKDIILQDSEYKFMKNIISKARYLIINVDIGMDNFNKIKI